MSIIAAYIVPHPPIILPEIGKGEERKVQKTIDSYKKIAAEIAESEPETIVITSPHATLYADYFHISPGRHAAGDFGQFGGRGLVISADYDEEFVQELEKTAEENNIPAGTAGERDPRLDHGTMIPLRFIQKAWDPNKKPFKIVRIGLSGESLLTHYEFGKCIAEVAEKLNRRTVFVASGDLSHRLKEDGPYGFVKEGPIFDQQITNIMRSGNFSEIFNLDPHLCDQAGECGLRSFVIMAGALDGKQIEPELLSYEGTFGVGYAVASFKIKGIDENSRFNRYETEFQINNGEDPYVALAKASLTTYLKTGKYMKVPSGLPAEMLNRRAGTFVSLKKNGELRGCIGTILPVRSSVAEEIIHNAVSAGVEDPRFPPVTLNELDDLDFSVDVLSEPEDISSPDQLDVKRYGVIVSSGYRRGLLLPDLEGVDTVEEQIDIARRKAGIPRGEPIRLQRFEVVRHT